MASPAAVFVLLCNAYNLGRQCDIHPKLRYNNWLFTTVLTPWSLYMGQHFTSNMEPLVIITVCTITYSFILIDFEETLIIFLKQNGRKNKTKWKEKEK